MGRFIRTASPFAALRVNSASRTLVALDRLGWERLPGSGSLTLAVRSLDGSAEHSRRGYTAAHRNVVPSWARPGTCPAPVPVHLWTRNAAEVTTSGLGGVFMDSLGATSVSTYQATTPWRMCATTIRRRSWLRVARDI